jgi:shikimate dehydrogenase
MYNREERGGAMNVDQQTVLIGSIASKRSRPGPLMNNAGYQELALNFLYVSFAVSESGLEAAVAGMRAMGFRGFAVSMPHKQTVMKLLDRIDDTAACIGAVNTVRREGDLLAGYNSDWVGAVSALQEVCDLRGKRVLLIGAGGAGRAIAYGLSRHSCDVLICNRGAAKAQELARHFGARGAGLEETGHFEYDILINATSVGFGTEECIVGQDAIRAGTVVMDIVFDRPDTPLLRMAGSKGCVIVPGYKMLLHQAVFSFELFTGRKAPIDAMERALLR